MKLSWMAMGSMLWLLPLTSGAQPRWQSEPGIDRYERRDDWRDEQRVRRLLRDFDQARRFRQVSTLIRVDRELMRLLDNEVRETRRELREERAEARQVRRNDPTASPWDVREEVREARQERMTLARLQALRDRAYSVQGRMDPLALRARRGVLVELADLARLERAQNAAERREEVREGRHARVWPRR